LGDIGLIALLTTVTCLVVAALGWAVLYAVRGRSVMVSTVVVTLTPVAAVSAAVAVNVRFMFISAHDSTAVSVGLACASFLAIGLAVVLGRRVAHGSRQLGDAVRRLAGPDRDPSTGVPIAAGGAPSEISGLARELEATQRSLERSRQREQALTRSRSELVAFMSHDLRTPLAGLRALAEGLEDGVIEDQPSALRQIRQTVDRMNGLVGDLFELSRLHAGAGHPPVASRMVSLVETAHDVVSELDEHARRLMVDLDLDLPPDPERLAVLGSGDELTRALTNLVGNAVRHTPGGGRVLVSAWRAPDGRACVSVTDSCGGIETGDLDRVFDVGWRGEPERGDDAGAGLGLAIAKGVAEAHRGSLSVHNVPGGCRFELELPGQTRQAGPAPRRAGQQDAIAPAELPTR
jgi:signal transduction histidine kinase